MPVHDWTRVPAGIFHAFHVDWVGALQRTLNSGRMPGDYYALAEQHMTEEDDEGDDGRTFGPDILTLHVDGFGDDSVPPPPDWAPDKSDGGIAVAEAPPKVAQRRAMSDPVRYAIRRRTVAVRHVSGDRLVALVEIVSPREQAQFAGDRMVRR